MGTNRSLMDLTIQQRLHAAAERMSDQTHFTTEEVKSLMYIHERMLQVGKIDRFRFREIIRTSLDITDDVMLDLAFHGFDKDNDGFVDQTEWIRGLSVMFRGTVNEMIEFVYYIYDMNGDRSLAREELYQCLRGCIRPGFAVDRDEIGEAEKEIVEIVMKKLDKDRDGQITFPDFQQAVLEDPLLLQACGPCLPEPRHMACFMSTFTNDYRSYTPIWGEFWGPNFGSSPDIADLPKYNSKEHVLHEASTAQRLKVNVVSTTVLAANTGTGQGIGNYSSHHGARPPSRRSSPPNENKHPLIEGMSKHHDHEHPHHHHHHHHVRQRHPEFGPHHEFWSDHDFNPHYDFHQHLEHGQHYHEHDHQAHDHHEHHHHEHDQEHHHEHDHHDHLEADLCQTILSPHHHHEDSSSKRGSHGTHHHQHDFVAENRHGAIFPRRKHWTHGIY